MLTTQTAITTPQLSTHVSNINNFIYKAEQEADKKIEETGVLYVTKPGVDGVDFKWCMWTEHFHSAMNRMTRESGLRNL
jgi:hypothetical protein